MKRTTLAYIAGVLDSDGTIGIKRSTYAMRVTKDCGQPIYSERICLKQVEPHAVDLLHELFGGYRFTEKPSAKRGRILNGWQVTDRKAAAVLKAVLPFLRIKRRQAETCLDLRIVKEASKKRRVAKGRGHMGSAPRHDWDSQRMEELWAEARQLNRVGR